MRATYGLVIHNRACVAKGGDRLLDAGERYTDPPQMEDALAAVTGAAR